VERGHRPEQAVVVQEHPRAGEPVREERIHPGIPAVQHVLRRPPRVEREAPQHQGQAACVPPRRPRPGVPPEQERANRERAEGQGDDGYVKPAGQREQREDRASHGDGDGGPQRVELEEPVALARQAVS
jgi:hypothetical protein